MRVSALAGQVGNPAVGVEAQVTDVLARIDALLEAVGSRRDNILRATVWLADWADYDALNRLWDAWLAGVGKPARDLRRRAGPPALRRRDYNHRRRTRCLIPGFDGALSRAEWMDELWARFSMGAPQRLRRSVERYSIVKSLRVLARRHGIIPKTVAKWKKLTSPADVPTGQKEPKSPVLSPEQEAIIVAFRRYTLLPLDDCLYPLHATIPSLTRSSLHRCLQRHGISRLPDVEGDKPGKQKFKTYPIGFFHIDIAEVRSEEGKLHLYVAIDRTSKFVFAELHDKADRPTAVAFLETLLQAVPYRLHTILTDNGIQFADLPKNRDGPTARWRVHRFDQICRANRIEHRLTEPNPWTNGQVERMNRTIKEATVKRYHYDSHDQLRRHLADFVAAYNFARRLKTLRGLTPYESICKAWSQEPDRFTSDPTHQTPGLNT